MPCNFAKTETHEFTKKYPYNIIKYNKVYEFATLQGSYI